MANLQKVENLAHQLMTKHGLIKKGWKFKWDNAKSRFGCCNYKTKTISMSKIQTELVLLKDAKDTILHEIAHALTPNDPGHGKEWKRMCVKIGARPERCPTTLWNAKGKKLNQNNIRYYNTNVQYYIEDVKTKTIKTKLIDWFLKYILGGILMIILIPMMIVNKICYPFINLYYKWKNRNHQYFLD